MSQAQPGSSSQNGTQMSQGHLSSQAAHRRKYRGLLKRSNLKNIRDNIFRMIDYVNTMAPSHRSLISGLSLLTFMQIFIIAMLPINPEVWDSKSVLGQVMTVISVFAYIAPSSVSANAHAYVGLVVQIILVVLVLLFIACYLMFVRLSKIHIFFVKLIAIVFNGLIPFISVLNATFIGKSVGYLVNSEGNLALNIIVLLLGILVHFPFIFAQVYLVTPTLPFRPQACCFIFSSSMMIYLYLTFAFAFFATCGSLISGIPGIVLIIIGLIMLILVFALLAYKPYSMGSSDVFVQANMFFVASFLNYIMYGVLSCIEFRANEAFPVISVIFIVIGMLFSKKYAQMLIGHMVKLTTEISQDKELFETLSRRNVLYILRISFEAGFPIAHNWSLFEYAHRRFPGDIEIDLIFARYAAIYSDETTTLRIAGHRVLDLKHGSLEMKHTLFQIFSVIQQRETAMSNTIKKSLAKISVKIEKCRGQIRYLWECVIRGNLDELENLAIHLKALEEEIQREYNQLCLIYPNNPFIAHSYASFLSEIVCDDKRAQEMQYMYQMLRMGKRTRVERCYFFGIRQLNTLPTEEQHSQMTRQEKQQGAVDQVYESSKNNGDAAYDQNIEDNNNEEKIQKHYVESMVDSVKLPSMSYGPFAIIFVMVIVMPVCIIPITVDTLNNIDNVVSGMEIVKYTSLMRAGLAELALITYHEVYHNTGLSKMPSLKQRWENSYGVSRPLPPNWDTDSDAVIAKVEEVRELVNQINYRAPRLVDSGKFDEALDILYGPTLYFSTYTTHNDWTTDNYSLEHIVTYLMGVGILSVDQTNFTDYLNNFEFWTMIKNTKEMLPHCFLFAQKVAEGINSLTRSTESTILVSVLLAILIPYVVALTFLIILIVRLEKEKNRIFHCFKALPKSALSAIVQQLNNQKQNEEESENKITSSAQEENALRFLSTSVEHGFGWAGRSWKILLLIFIFTLASVAVTVVLITISLNIGNKFDQINPIYIEVPRVNTLFTTITMDVLRLGGAAEFTGPPSSWLLPVNGRANYTLVNADLEELRTEIIESINGIRVGTKVLNSTGLSIVGENMVNLLTQATCEEKPRQLTDLFQIFECASYESSLSVIWHYIERLVKMVGGELAFDNPAFDIIISWLLGFSYQSYVGPSIAELDDLISSTVSTTKFVYILLPVVICTIVIMVCGIMLIPLFLMSADAAKWSLRLLLFCQPNIVLDSKPILKVLSNDFSEPEENKDTSGVNFYETVVSNLLDGVVFMSNDLVIHSANQAVQAVLGIDPHEIIGKHLNDIFKSPKEKESTLKAFFAAINGAMRSQRSPSIEAEVDVLRNEDSITLLLSMTAVSTTGNVQIKATNAEGLSVLALVMKDMTSTIASNKLLAEERVKSEKLLLMILPPIIVNKLQGGEKNINFSVKSASIMFVDIVSFTPWCGSNKAFYVMATLNRLFLEFDRILKKYDRMTKIKCIGDCYMCAGGIFDEINQPAEHCKQTISFGIDIINALQLLNIELGETLRIRVGVNTGGPIVAGVLGIGKPTFDILGPDICLAAMMEHHGVPMHVHIPQHCYELVYGSLFRIKERGDVEVKGKMYHTYVVSGYDQAE